MTYLKPCAQCARKNDCELRATIRKALKGIPITAGKVKCDVHREDFPPGTRVRVTAEILQRRTIVAAAMSSESSGEGTVVRFDQSKLKFAVVLDDDPWFEGDRYDFDGDGGNAACRFQRFYHNELKRLDEPAWEVCVCGWSKQGDICDIPKIRDKKPDCEKESIEAFQKMMRNPFPGGAAHG